MFRCFNPNESFLKNGLHNQGSTPEVLSVEVSVLGWFITSVSSVHTYQNARFQTIFWLQYSLKFSLSIIFTQKFSNENEILLNILPLIIKRPKLCTYQLIWQLFQIIILRIFFYVRKKAKRNSIKLLNEIAFNLLKHSNHKFARTALIN